MVWYVLSYLINILLKTDDQLLRIEQLLRRLAKELDLQIERSHAILETDTTALDSQSAGGTAKRTRNRSSGDSSTGKHHHPCGMYANRNGSDLSECASSMVLSSTCSD
jgi:hypothetical protein